MRNQIEDIASLKHLKNLSYLNFSFNQVADISPLLELESLRSVNVLNNPLNSQAEAILQRLDKEGVHLFAQSTTFHPEIPAYYDLALAAVLLTVLIIYLSKRVEITPERYKRKGIDLAVAVFVFSLALIMLNWTIIMECKEEQLYSWELCWQSFPLCGGIFLLTGFSKAVDAGKELSGFSQSY